MVRLGMIEPAVAVPAVGGVVLSRVQDAVAVRVLLPVLVAVHIHVVRRTVGRPDAVRLILGPVEAAIVVGILAIEPAVAVRVLAGVELAVAVEVLAGVQDAVAVRVLAGVELAVVIDVLRQVDEAVVVEVLDGAPRADLAAAEDPQAALAAEEITLERRDDLAAEGLHVPIRRVEADVVPPRQARQVEGRVEARLDEVVVPAEDPAGVFEARGQARPSRGAEEVVPRIVAVDGGEAARGAGLPVDGETGLRRDELHRLVSVADVHPAEVPQQAAEKDVAAAAELLEADVVGLALVEREAQRPGLAEEIRFREVDRVAVGAGAALDEGREDLAASQEVPRRIGRLEEAPLQAGDAAPDLDLVAIRLGPLDLDVHLARVGLGLHDRVLPDLPVAELGDLAHAEAQQADVEQVPLVQAHLAAQHAVARVGVARELDPVDQVLLVFGDLDLHVRDPVVLVELGVERDVEIASLAVVVLDPLGPVLQGAVVEDLARAQRQAGHDLGVAEHLVPFDVDLPRAVLRPFVDRHREVDPLLGLLLPLLLGLQLGVDPLLALPLRLAGGGRGRRRLFSERLFILLVLRGLRGGGPGGGSFPLSLGALEPLAALDVRLQLHDLRLDQHVEIPEALVGRADVLRVLVELRRMVQGLAGGPGGQPEGLFGQLEGLAQLAVGVHGVADEGDLLDLGLRAFMDVEGHLALAGVDGGQPRAAAGLQVALLGQELLDRGLRAPQDREIDRLASAHLALGLHQALLDVGLRDGLHAHERHVVDEGPVADVEDQVDGARVPPP